MEKILQKLSKDLIEYLVTSGYTHINVLGVTDEKPDVNNENKNDFVLVPLKNDETKTGYDGSDVFIEEITSPEIADMLDGDDFMNFVVEMPIGEFEQFIKS